jgi:hypothetical protein
MLAVQQHRAQQLAETEKNIKEILARRGEGEYDPNQQVVAFDGFIPTEPAKDLDKMTKDELITLAKGHIKNVRAMKKTELLKALKEFMVKNPGKILLGTERALVEHVDDEVIDNEDDGDEGLNDAITPVLHEDVDAFMSCSIIECNGTPSADLVHCDACDLWFCKDLHGPHGSHSAQTHFKEGRVPKKVDDGILEEPIQDMSVDMSVDQEARSASENIENIVEQQLPFEEDAQVTGHKRKSSELEVALQREQRIDLSRVDVATRKLREILAKPSKTQKDQLRSVLNFSSYDITFLTMVAQEFGIDVTSATKKSRATRIDVLDYLLSML